MVIAWYVIAVGSLGVFPFLAPWLSRSGLGDQGAAWVLAALPLGNLVAGPFWSAVVDRYDVARRVHVGVILLAAILLSGLLLPVGPSVLAAFVVGFAFARAPIFPLADAATVHALGSRYGVVRGLGSLGYIGAILTLGLLRESWPSSPVVLSVALLLLAAALSGVLPPIPHRVPVKGETWQLLALPRVRRLLLISVLNGLSLTSYDHLFGLHMERLHMAPSVTSAAIAWGVVVEVVIMVWGSSLLPDANHPDRGRWLLVAAVGAGVPRFLLTGSSTSPAVLIAIQGLHGLQFGLYWLVAVHRMGQLAPEGSKRSAQALLMATGFGLAPLTALAVGGTWLGHGSTSALFFALSVPAVLATLAAVVDARKRD